MVAGADSIDDMDLLRHGGMSARRADTDDRLASVLAALDRDYMRGVVARMTASGSSPLGFRTAGTAEEHAVARYLAAELGGLGLRDVRLEPVPVDAWRFRADSLTVDGAAYECASFGGAPGTGGAGIDGEIVYVGRGSRADLAGLDLAGRIALIDWRGGEPARNLLWPSLSAAECARAGAVAAVITSLPGGDFYQAPGALGSGDAYCLPQTPPLATIRKEDALQLMERLRFAPVIGRLVVDVEVTPAPRATTSLGCCRAGGAACRSLSPVTRTPRSRAPSTTPAASRSTVSRTPPSTGASAPSGRCGTDMHVPLLVEI